LVGELVLTRNQILQLCENDRESTFGAPAQRLNLITSELQEGVMKTRMQPIGNVWTKLPRVVRDLSRQMGKNVRVDMEGKDTELDKTIIEAIKDPLTHIVRNTVDHGVEAPDERVAAGKDPEGRLLLQAYHEGGQVNIEVTDDGAGIDLDRVKHKAVERGLITPETAARMSDVEATYLVFLPGFSTAESVTNVSGRGVGMDVVKTNIEKIGGSVDVRTTRGQGTTFKFKIPLTLAIIPALSVTCAGNRYAIPQVSLLELLRVEADGEGGFGIEHIHGAPVYRLRGRLLPIVDLRGQLGAEVEDRSVVNIVVLQADDRQFGLVVDEINDTQEIVVKPLGQVAQDLELYSGATILGDGRVALILDVMGLAQRANILTAHGEGSPFHDLHAVADGKDASESTTLLLLGVGDDRRVAMPLSDVARLEEFNSDSLELAGHTQVVQYRGEIMQLIDLGSSMGLGGWHPGGADEPVSVVVYHHAGRDVGLIVNEVLDIVDEIVDERDDSVVVHDRVTDLVDVATVVDPHVRVDPELTGVR
ncbi:MAG: chemotaxis protein CheA, partial [Acidimicrobiales bacterium]